MRKTKILVLFLTIVLVLSSLIGCKKKGSQDYDENNFLTEEQALAEYGNKYRIVRDPVTIKIFVPRGSMNPQYSTMKMFKKLSEVTNLKFAFTEADTSAYTNLRTVAWSNAEDLPDFFLFSNTITEQVLYSEQELLIPFNDDDLEVNGLKVGNLIDNYMPTYKKLLNSNFGLSTSVNAKDVVTLDNGLMYATVSCNDVPRDMTYKMFINQKWIDNINTNASLKTKLKNALGVESLPNSSEIRTIEDLMLVFRAFKRLDANMNGDADDEVPVSSTAMDYLRNFILESYGYVSNGVELLADGSSFTFVPATEAYKKYLETAATMYSEKLLDQNVFSILDNSKMAGKGYDNKLGCFCAAAAYLVSGYDLESNYVTFGPLTSSYYTGNPIHLGFNSFTASATEIPYNTKYVREVARLIDIFYSELGTQLIAYGEEGVDFTWDDEEKTSWTFHVPDSWEGTQEEYRATITPGVGTGASVYWSYDFVGKMNDPIITKLNRQSELYMPYLKIPVPQNVIMTADDYNEAVLISTTLDKYVIMRECDFIKGDKDINGSDWNAYLTELKNYKYEQLVALYNKALNRRK